MNSRISPFVPCRARRRLLVSLSPCSPDPGLAGAHNKRTGTHRPRRARPITWSARGTHNEGLAIPSAQTTLLVFLRPGQSQSEETIKLLLPVLKDRKDVQLVGIVSGDDAPVAAAQLEKGAWKAPVVADADYTASGKFGVRSGPRW